MPAPSKPDAAPSKPDAAPLLIGIGGAAGHGKDETGRIIGKIAAEGGAPTQYIYDKFAAALRRALSTITDIPAADTISDADKARPLPDREYTRGDLAGRICIAIAEALTGRACDTVNTAIAVATGRFCVAVSGGAGHLPHLSKFRLQHQIIDIAGVLTGEDFSGKHWVGVAAAADATDATDGATLTAASGEDLARKVRIPSMTIGRALQIVGTECFRDHVDDNIWVRSFLSRWNAMGRRPTLVPDTRFPNEVAGVKTAGNHGVTIFVDRPGYGRDDGRSTTHASANVSADFVKTFDFLIVNDGSLADLEAKIRAIWPEIKMLAQTR